MDQKWSAIARELLLDWRCPEYVSDRLDRQLVTWSEKDLLKVFVDTAGNFPIVVARLLNGLRQRSTIDQVASQLCSSSASDALRDEVTYRLHVDQGFFIRMARPIADSIREGTALPDDPMVRSNIAVLCNDNGKFRHWLAAYLLYEVAP